MKLFIKQDVLTIRDKFSVKDEKGKIQYTVKAEIFTVGKKIHIYNRNNDEICLIKQKMWSIVPKYEVIIDGEKKAEIKRVFHSFKPKYFVDELGWEINGDFWAHGYIITKDNRVVAKISKKLFTLSGDRYELDITDSSNRVFALSVVLVIDTDWRFNLS